MFLLDLAADFIRRSFCHHEDKHHRNIYGDEIIYTGNFRTVFKCTKCGRYRYERRLILPDHKNCKQRT